ncbi:hypothetical protein CAPTEDRAFT_222606 [Capitella teleta]|uniref:Uncharacterized protein n=1 Tax=Capitella teleta TaxID=283909 RepID=R7T6N6_CAPTE|nr:hypothetical protein CAPTEDRAFT_222606 [Capitella teleta]|eukprot:ELT87030.1 hypothetical protein CAPTEDRAFT_222606 [Capitella teleta]
MDGSKSEDAVGCAFHSRDFNLALGLPCQMSVYTAELIAINETLTSIALLPYDEFVICTDSFSSILAISSIDLIHSYVQSILQKCTNLAGRDKRIIFIWCPSHVGIPGNETADTLAQQASGMNILNCPIPHTDFKPITRSFVETQWQSESDQETGNKLHDIEPDIGSWPPCQREKRRDEIVIARLRIGHTFLTYSHLLSGNDAPMCYGCDCTFRAVVATNTGTLVKQEYGHIPGYTLQKVELLDLRPGDHIAFPRGMAYKDPTFWHHAIVDGIEKASGGLIVIHFYNTSPKTLDASLGLIEAFARIKREVIPMSDNIVYRVNYDDPKEVLSPEETLKRAHSKLGEGKYNVWSNNCEHFATWCKTGEKKCGQVQPAKLLFSAIVGTGSIKGMSTGIAEVVSQSSVVTAVKEAYGAGTKFAGGAARAALDTIGVAALFAALFSCLIETVFTAIECLEAKKRLLHGKINQREFDDIVGKRVAEGVGDIAGGVGGLIGGAVAGAWFGPMGALFGSIMGGMAGGLGGRLTGWGLGKAGVAVRDCFESEPVLKESSNKMQENRDYKEISQTPLAKTLESSTRNLPQKFDFFSLEYNAETWLFVIKNALLVCVMSFVLSVIAYLAFS